MPVTAEHRPTAPRRTAALATAALATAALATAALATAALATAALALFVSPVAAEYPVSVVPSDDAALTSPVSRDHAVTANQVLDMVCRAVDLVGGMQSVVPADAGMVLLKPNIGTRAEPRTGVNTDDRVVRAVAILVHEAAPGARILLAEAAGGWISPALRDCTDARTFGNMNADGFELSGHRATVRELRARGVDIECFDLNFDRAYSLHPANGGLATDEYSIAASILDADVWINLPVAKTHGAKITCCMKNHFGILPGTVYGWSKSNGTRHHPGIPHSPRQMDEAWVDLYGLTRVDLNVVDMIAGSEAGPFEEDNRKRANTILAGRNPVATDLVVARLMGFNPDDFEFAELAWQNDLGPRTIDEVEVRGADVAPLVQRWKKAGVQYGRWGEWAEHANYGMGPRYWTFLGPLDRDHAFSDAELAALEPRPGRDDWSEVVYFGHDKINLDKHFDDPVNCAVYAFTHFTMTSSDSVRFWVGSDEDLSVWVDGELIHRNDRRRRHSLGMDKIPGYVEAGEHRLLVRAGQGRGGFDFSFNVCEPIDDELYAGNRYPGVRYYVEMRDRPQVAASRVGADAAGGEYFGSSREANILTFQADDPLLRSRTAPDTVLIDDAPAIDRGDLVGLLVQVAGLDRPDLNADALEILGNAPFTLGHVGFGREGYFPDYGPDITRLLDWLGLRYAISYGYGSRESLKTLHGWLDQGRIPVTGNLERRRGRRWRGSRRAEWGAITGFRRAGDSVELRMVRPDNTFWAAVTGGWSGTFPGGLRENCPVLVAEAGGEPLSGAVLVDSIASLALELGLREEVESGREEWGTPTVPAGLSAWDGWVIDWERLPLTPEWAVEPETLDRLERLASRFPPQLARQRGLAARFFAAAAERTDRRKRRELLQEAAEGYLAAVEAMEQLVASMPLNDDVDQLTAEDRDRLARIGETRPLIRRARQGERQALAALVKMLGRPRLPEAMEDPLTRKDRGVKLFTWRAVTDETVHRIELVGGDLSVELLAGDEPEEMSSEFYAEMPKKRGWLVVIDPSLLASGRYWVEEQPGAENGWRVVVMADDGWAWNDDNAPVLAVWAVPGK